ncbi:MAG: YiiX/YebB-like N1pC/P60 family cysteine hydrolase [candidate division Zixibacteria bacterium]|nr:YiiX/YebB-like N1pC/P60 family cysteine hydrolase [candidate division Zixibacteria bacterium]
MQTATGFRRIVIRVIICVAALYLLLLIPASQPPQVTAGEREPFAWRQDEYWSTLEARFKQARQIGCPQLASRIDTNLLQLRHVIDSVATDSLAPDALVFTQIEIGIFELGVLMGACPGRLTDYVALHNRVREFVKRQSRHWEMNSIVVRSRMYRLLYGGRAAIEEVMMQAPKAAVPSLTLAHDEPSETPSAQILGVTIHSGDILVSRGGAPTSALIARGNDYPGNFSHVALVHVDANSGKVSLIESHIEKGVAVADISQYLKDTKLRVMVLRLRFDLPVLVADPQLPHKVATAALAKAIREHIPYDFSMDYQDTSKLFCSEVASAPYAQFGVKLWMGLSQISGFGIKSWLSAFGVRHFETQEPSDLEYDPQLSVVAEWRDPETLFGDRVDNAIIDVLLERADSGWALDYTWYLLPVARVMKGYSMVMNAVNKIGPIPEGMDATAALRNDWFSKLHVRLKKRVLVLVDQFRQENGYMPPYWELVKLARKGISESA